MKNIILAIPFVILAFACTPSTDLSSSDKKGEDYDPRIAMLNELRNDILVAYGTVDGWSRINMGPCGRFAHAFRDEWNKQFEDSVTIVFLMRPDRTECNHVLVRLPDGHLFDAGLGVMTDSALHVVMPDNVFEEMPVFDYDLLDRRSYGLKRSYYNCPNYSDSVTATLLRRHFSKLQ